MFDFAIIIAIAFGLDALLGDPRSSRHPVALLGRLATKVEKLCRKLLGNGFLAGGLGWFMVVAPVVILAFVSVWLVNYGPGRIFAAVLAGIWLYICIALKSLWQHANAIAKPLAMGELENARRALAMIVSRDTAELAETEIARGAVESLGENLVDAVNSAVFWAAVGFVLGGAPLAAGLAALLRGANTLDACWGYKNERYMHFGRMAARMDDILHFIPARLSLLCIALAAPLVGGRMGVTLKTGFRYRKAHLSPNSAWGMAAFAGALGLRLGGPTVYDGVTENNPYMGTSRAQLTAGDIRRGQALAAWSAAVFAVLMLVLTFVWLILFTL